jgi:isochorismate synthase
MIDFFIKVKQQKQLDLPFVIYSKPNKDEIVGYFQKNDHLYLAADLSEKGFVFASFDGDQKILIPGSHAERWVTKISLSDENKVFDIENSINPSAKKEFETLVQKGIDAINKGCFSKVVLSREEIMTVSDFDIVTIFEKLLYLYPTAFSYCWFHPKIGLWMGATPERLLKVEAKKFHTVALAGTQPFKDTLDIIWKSKEREEQQFVTDYILENLKAHTSEMSVSSPYTIKAGNLLHIRTDIVGVINQKANLEEIVTILHPTPAVCGLPKNAAKDFILTKEGYSRTFYTGFLGELNVDSPNEAISKSDLFVNLRCMQIKDQQAHLYVGCGITKDSNPEKEWTETVNKSLTMKKIIL